VKFSLGHGENPIEAIKVKACHRFKPKNMTEDIFIAEILGHKLLPGATALSVGQSYKDFYTECGKTPHRFRRRSVRVTVSP
jgi:hypothetical protein